jgi:glycosyltransferase involved in cell wall biosynthesis
MAHQELPSFIANKRFYLQLSMSEGFPNALCEAMLSGCIPIVSNVGAMPFIVGETGYVLNKKDPDLLVQHINHALESNLPELSLKARNRISDAFPLRNRADQLIKSIKQHLQN